LTDREALRVEGGEAAAATGRTAGPRHDRAGARRAAGRAASATRRAAPRAVAARRPYRQLLASAGFTGIGSRDVTPAYLRTARAWIEQTRLHLDALVTARGAASVSDSLATWEATVEAVTAGWLRRSLYWARR
jgi:hypothetical protein